MRKATLEVAGRSYRTVVDDAIRLSVTLDFDGDQAKAFGLPSARSEHIKFGDSTCDTARGGAFNAESLELIPHGNGTHTETVGHLVDHDVPVGERVAETLIPCTVVSVDSVRFGDTEESYPHEAAENDRVLTRDALESRANRLELPDGFLRAVILRSRPDEETERFRDYTNTNPPYPTSEALRWIVDREVQHLLVDLPSIDREREGGSLANHRSFWNLTETARRQHPASSKTITELLYVPQSVPDGIYFLDIDVPDFATDAAPSRPLLYEAVPADD